MATPAGARHLLPALAALALPVLAGLAWLWTAGAPGRYLATNAVALAVGALWTAFGRGPKAARAIWLLAAALVVLLAMPRITGPEINGVARWLPLGPLVLHTGAFAIPALAVLAARAPNECAPILLAALFGTFVQPDAASGFALTIAAVGIHHVSRDWKVGLVAIVAFASSLVMAAGPPLAPQPFVEHVLTDAALRSVWIAFGLAASFAAAFLLVIFAVPLPRVERFALGGALFGFGTMALMSSYPAPLIGYGASSILGFAFALGLRTREGS